MLSLAAHKAVYDPDAMGVLETLLLAFVVSTGAMAAIAVLYLVKSALGINLMPGPSPLHDLLYPLVRGY